MAERIVRCTSLERARNEAIRWLESKGVSFGPNRQIVIGRMQHSPLYMKEVGVSARTGARPFWRLRLDYDPDPDKGCHYNAEFFGGTTEKVAFCFPGTEDLIAQLSKSRSPRG